MAHRYLLGQTDKIISLENIVYLPRIAYSNDKVFAIGGSIQ